MALSLGCCCASVGVVMESVVASAAMLVAFFMARAARRRGVFCAFCHVVKRASSAVWLGLSVVRVVVFAVFLRGSWFFFVSNPLYKSFCLLLLGSGLQR